MWMRFRLIPPSSGRPWNGWWAPGGGNVADTACPLIPPTQENIEAGLKACQRKSGRPLLNSASLERIGALDLVLQYDTEVIVTASGDEGMPDGSEQRIEFASRMVDAALGKGIELSRIHVDCLVFPISVAARFGMHYFDAVRTMREKYGPEIHVTGGLSNVSFGLPKRKIINDVFINLAVQFGADGGIVDPVA